MKKILIHSWPGLGLLIFSGLFFLSVQGCANDKDSDDIEPDKSGENTINKAELVNTYWRLTELEGEPVVTAEGKREMKFTLRGESQVNGFGGCNSFFGSYTHDENSLKFSEISATRMFCAGEMDRENQFYKSLAEAARYKITGQKLYLYDDKGETLQQLQAVYLK